MQGGVRFSELIRSACGIRITASKKQMLEARLQKRLRALGMSSYPEYCACLFTPTGMRDELVHMIDAVTINKTDFFREPEHIGFLRDRIVPESLASGPGRTLRF